MTVAVMHEPSRLPKSTHPFVMPIPKLQVEGLDQTVVSCVPKWTYPFHFSVEVVCHAPTTVGGCCPVLLLLCLGSSNLVCMYVCGDVPTPFKCDFVNHSILIFFHDPDSILGVFLLFKIFIYLLFIYYSLLLLLFIYFFSLLDFPGFNQ